MAKKGFVNVHDNTLKDSMGRYRINSLFFEHKVEGMTPIWTLGDVERTEKGKTYPSLKKLYMEYKHVPGLEYEFAMDVFGSWEHWNKLSNSSGLKAVFAQWREELDVKVRSEALKEMVKSSKGGTASALQAAKYLAEKGYQSKRGRPSKAEIEGERRIEAGINSELEDDLERITGELH